MNIRFIFFTGQSGSGKDTQSDLLVGYLKEKGYSVLYINNGNNIRGYDTGSWVSNLIRENNKKGLLAPQMTISYFAQDAMEKFGKNPPDFIVWNGSPRGYDELVGLKNLMQFFQVKGEVVFISVPDKVCRKRLLERALLQNRPETATKEALENKLAYFNQKTIGAIVIMRDIREDYSKWFDLITINGESLPEIVFSEVKESLSI